MFSLQIELLHLFCEMRLLSVGVIQAFGRKAGLTENVIDQI